jgi:hypothetical protein
VGLTFTAFCRVFGPLLGGSLFAWSISQPHPFPLNRWAAFLLFAVVFGGAVHLARQLTDGLNRPKDERA